MKIFQVKGNLKSKHETPPTNTSFNKAGSQKASFIYLCAVGAGATLQLRNCWEQWRTAEASFTRQIPVFPSSLVTCVFWRKMKGRKLNLQ